MGNSIEMKLFERFAAPAIIQKFYFWFDGRLLNGIYLWINEKINEMKQCCSRNLKSWMEWKLFNEGKASCGCGKQTFLQLNGNEIEGKCGPLQAAKGGRSQSTNHQTSQFKALNELWNVWFGVVDGEWSPAEQPTLFLLSSAKTKSCLWWRRERSCCGALEPFQPINSLNFIPKRWMEWNGELLSSIQVLIKINIITVS